MFVAQSTKIGTRHPSPPKRGEADEQGAVLGRWGVSTLPYGSVEPNRTEFSPIGGVWRPPNRSGSLLTRKGTEEETHLNSLMKSFSEPLQQCIYADPGKLLLATNAIC